MFFAFRQALVALLLVSVTVAGDSPKAKPPRDSDLPNSRVRHWLRQWRKHLEDASVNEDKRSNLGGLHAIAFSEYLAEMGQCASAMALCNAEEPQAIANLAGVFVSTGNVAEADYLASSLEQEPLVKVNGETYDRYLSAMYFMMISWARKEKYAEAECVIRKVEKGDPEYAARMWCRLAEWMSDYGHYEKAISCIDAVSDVESITEYRQHILKQIKKEREANVNHSRRINGQQDGLERILHELRLTVGVLTESKMPKSVASVEERNKYISSIPDPSRRASLWRQVALEYWQADDIQLSQKAARKCHEAVLKIPPVLGAVRTTESVLLADLYFSIGRKQQAIDLVKNVVTDKDTGVAQQAIGFLKSLVGDETGEILNELGQMLGSGALMTSVLVRAGEVPMAFKLARNSWDSDWTVHQWMTLGAICAFCDRTEDVEAELDRIENDLAKAFLCLGIAYGLHEQESADTDPQLHSSEAIKMEIKPQSKGQLVWTSAVMDHKVALLVVLIVVLFGGGGLVFWAWRRPFFLLRD